MNFITALIIVYLLVELCVCGDDEWEITAEIKCPVGIISMFYGDYRRIPRGYKLCDGTCGTPNLISKFIVGADPNARRKPYPYPPPYKVGTIGGQNQNVLEISNLPAHNHVIDPSAAMTTSDMDSIDGVHNTHTLNLQANDINSSHIHAIDFNSQEESTQHSHSVPEHNTTGGLDDGEHDHFIIAYQDEVNVDGEHLDGISVERIGNGGTGQPFISEMVFTESMDMDIDGAHSHTIPAVTTDIPNVGHSHGIFGDTNNDGLHGHDVDGSIDDGRHSHLIEGWTEYTGQGNPIDNRPPFYAVYYICCVGKDIEAKKQSGKD